jgi:hypothetical protein
VKLVLLLATLALLLFAPGVAFAVTKAECVAAYEEGQQSRARAALRQAREQFLVCADPACPNATRSDCTVWVGQLDDSMPTLAFAVTAEDGKDVTDVTVYVDDQKLAESLDGKALPVDPGKHTLRFERAGKTVTLELVVREGEKNRAVPVAFGGGQPKPKPAVEGGTISPGVWVLGGIGVAGFGLFGVMGGVALGERADAEDTCAPDCTDSEVASIRAKFIVADVGLGVGIAATASAVVLAVVNLTSGGDAPDAAEAPATAVRVEPLLGPLEGGAYFGARGRF